jgi:hypothetical protein
MAHRTASAAHHGSGTRLCLSRCATTATRRRRWPPRCSAAGINSSGAFEVYNISNNSITNATALGTVGLNCQFSGIGNFSGIGESDMLLRNSNTGGLEVYDIANNQITNAAFIGTVGLDWQFS